MGEVINFSGLNVYTLGLAVVLAFLWASFVFYKKSAETHFEESSVLDMIVMAGFWGFIFGRIGFVLFNLTSFVKHWGRVFMISDYPGLDRWFALLGFLLAVLYSIRKKKGKYFDYLDLVLLGYFSGVSIFWALLSMVTFSWQNLVIGFLNILISFWLWKTEKTYRFFDWYKGSKTYARTGLVFGFGLSAIGVVYLIELLLFKASDFLGLGLGTGLFVIGLALVYIRSGRMIEEDFIFLKKWKKTKTK